MKSAVVRLLGNRKSFYLSCVIGSLFFIFSLFVIFFTDLSLELVGSLFIVTVLLYTFSLISYVWRDRRISSTLIRESRALRAELDKAAIRDLTEVQKSLYQSFERFEKNLTSTLNEHEKYYLEQLKTQAFNSHLAVQELKSFIIEEPDNVG